VNNGKIEEPPQIYISRNPLWLLISALFSLIFLYYAYTLLRDLQPIGFLISVPACLLAFHTLWTFLHPFAGIYADKVELKPSLFNQKTRYLIDIKRGGLDKKGNLIIEYTDGETERFRLYGIHKAQLQTLLAALPKGK
jgi:hypothetical protein